MKKSQIRRVEEVKKESQIETNSHRNSITEKVTNQNAEKG